jgi:hypothetical protein
VNNANMHFLNFLNDEVLIAILSSMDSKPFILHSEISIKLKKSNIFLLYKFHFITHHCNIELNNKKLYYFGYVL